MTIEQIETFLAINETNSISMAAKKLFISQSTVSHRIGSLERELGFSLFTRTRGERFVSLSLKGEEFIEIARRWKALWTETNLWKVQESRMTLRVGGVDSINTSILSKFYRGLIREENNLSLSVSSHWSKIIYDSIENYDIDMGFVLKPLKYPNIIVNPLFKARGVVISLRESSYPDLIHPRDLTPAHEIVFSSMPGYDAWHAQWWDSSEKDYSSVDTISLLFSVLDSPEQWSVVPLWIARAFEERYPIKISELSVTPPEYSCYQIYNRHPRPIKQKALEVFSRSLEAFLNSEELLGTIL